MQKNKRNILIVNNTGSYILKFRLELINKLQKQGYYVHAAFPFDGAELQLQQEDVHCTNLNLNSYSKNIIQESMLIIEIIKTVRKLKIDLLLPFTIKPVLYTSFAAFFYSSKVISTITGMGKIYTDTSLKYKLASKISNLAYRIVFLNNTHVIFQNPDDQNHFISKKILPSRKACLVNGSGINLKKYPFKQRSNSENISFVMVARILREKGVEEYCLAVKNIIKKHNVRCSLIGGEVPGNPLTIKGLTLTQFCIENNIEYLGHRTDISALLEAHTVFVLPSYREGTPRSTLEALASGMPIITTDAPGTKETVIDDSNGFLIIAKSPNSLEKAIDRMIVNSNKIAEMSLNSRELAERKFDVELVSDNYIKIVEKTMRCIN